MKLWGIIDDAEVVSYAEPSIKESTYSSGVHSVQTGEYEEDPVDDRYKLGNGELLTIMLKQPSNDEGYQDVKKLVGSQLYVTVLSMNCYIFNGKWAIIAIQAEFLPKYLKNSHLMA